MNYDKQREELEENYFKCVQSIGYLLLNDDSSFIRSFVPVFCDMILYLSNNIITWQCKVY